MASQCSILESWPGILVKITLKLTRRKATEKPAPWDCGPGVCDSNYETVPGHIHLLLLAPNHTNLHPETAHLVRGRCLSALSSHFSDSLFKLISHFQFLLTWKGLKSGRSHSSQSQEYFINSYWNTFSSTFQVAEETKRETPSLASHLTRKTLMRCNSERPRASGNGAGVYSPRGGRSQKKRID